MPEGRIPNFSQDHKQVRKIDVSDIVEHYDPTGSQKVIIDKFPVLVRLLMVGIAEDEIEAILAPPDKFGFIKYPEINFAFIQFCLPGHLAAEIRPVVHNQMDPSLFVK